jgi:polyisoprenoid-binding protein YceI
MNEATGSKRGRLALAVAAGATALTGTAWAQAPRVVPAPPSGVYKVDPNHTEILFGVSHLGFTTYYGMFTGASGALTLNGESPAASRVEIHVPTNSVMTASATLNSELKGPQWLNAQAFPEMIFRSEKVVMTGPESADVEGELTLHGVTRPLTLEARFNRSGINPLDHQLTVGFQAHGQLKRSDYGVTTYVPMVGDEVELILSGAFERPPGVSPAVAPR